MYSFFMILYNIFKLQKDKYASANFFSSSDPQIIKAKLKELDSELSKRDFISVFPSELKGLASRALSSHEASRPDLYEVKTNAWFQDNLVKGIYYLDNFYSLPESNKNLFLASLVKMIPQYSQEVVEKRVIPFINANMIHQNLMYNLTLIALVTTDKKLIQPFEKRKEEMWPIFSNLLKSKKISGQLLYLLVSYIDVVCEILNDAEIQNHIVGLLFKCFDCKVPQIQLVSIEKTYALCQKVSFSEMKSKILPRMLMLCSDPDPKVKKRALQFIKERIDLLDPSLVQSQAFSIIEANLGQNNPASINFLLLDLMEEISKSYEVDIIANKVLPILISFLVNKSSSKQEFERYHESIVKMIARIKDKRLQELNSQPFKTKVEEPEDNPISIQSLEQLVANTKVEGFDSLFSKQNQIGGLSPAQPTTISGGTNFGFESLSNPVQTPTTQLPSMNTPQAAKSTFPDFSLFAQPVVPRPPEKQQPISRPGPNSLTMMDDLGLGSMLNQQKKPQILAPSKSNYEALDMAMGDLTLSQPPQTAGMLGQTYSSKSEDPFSRGMGGLMMGDTNDPFAKISTSSAGGSSMGTAGFGYMGNGNGTSMNSGGGMNTAGFGTLGGMGTFGPGIGGLGGSR